MSLRNDLRFGTAVALPLVLLLSACGGGGGGEVANIPPPPPSPTPTPTPGVASLEIDKSWIASPATKAGTYDLIGLTNRKTGGTSSSQFTGSGDFRLEITGPTKTGGFTYTLDGPTNFLPGGASKFNLPVPIESWDFNPGGPNFRYENPYGDTEQFFGENLKEYELSADGSKKLREDYDYARATLKNGVIDLSSGDAIGESLLFDIGLSYVAMGEWSWGPDTTSGDGTRTPTGDSNSILLVYGNRTPSSGIPVSGTASFDAHTLGASSADRISSLPFSLTADFAQRSISTEIRQASLFDVSGSAPFSNSGSFDIPLTGSAGPQAATGVMDGAFFGPHAEQVGGVVSVEGPQGPVFQDAFVGKQH